MRGIRPGLLINDQEARQRAEESVRAVYIKRYARLVEAGMPLFEPRTSEQSMRDVRTISDALAASAGV